MLQEMAIFNRRIREKRVQLWTNDLEKPLSAAPNRSFHRLSTRGAASQWARRTIMGLSPHKGRESTANVGDGRGRSGCALKTAGALKMPTSNEFPSISSCRRRPLRARCESKEQEEETAKLPFRRPPPFLPSLPASSLSGRPTDMGIAGVTRTCPAVPLSRLV